MTAAAPAPDDTGLPRIAISPEEREAIYRFRYRVYGQELGRKLGNADHERGRVTDVEDDQPYTTLLYTGTPEDVTGTMRVRLWRPGEVPLKDYEAYSMELFEGIERLVTSELGRLMVTPDRRGGSAVPALLAGAADVVAARGRADILFASCATGLVRYYRALGMRTYAGRLLPTPDGVEVPLVLFPTDVDHLERVGSFLCPLITPMVAGRPALDLQRWSEVLDGSAMPVQMDPAAVWSRVQTELVSGDGTDSVLSTVTLQRLASAGFLIDVPAGELLTEKGLTQQEMFIILEGAFEVLDGNRRLRVVSKGELIGEIAFFSSARRRSASVRALVDSQVLVLRRSFVEQLRHDDPTCAAELLFHAARLLADRLYPLAL